ncbi:hypothetical protein [Peribacillus sp. V2I11]|uniref:hypothetical protein n=1 Tax=Peribacillus sp. V2I11 TaxID=3042277 RepID=UPI0027899739|nr:hypothetical protein [Peribacillus sp. V2I11]MDQ0879791.1 hypothetical protein [Peribacillus sp. V2I11]MDQ0880146.1 hypothetical protein [Peribacillus sp. V2I11]MDQ0880633.1 hypothetical protein [Peribacillus sp. V2I11]MDQ0882046.1 hypothetical protein [Peribacillus sp. V2I11]MDQ0882062.1 hypothetical protein [Peribacillus sp. V2I11]
MSTREDKEGPNRLRRMNTRRSLSAKKQTIPNGTYLKEEVVNTRGTSKGWSR